MDIEGAKENLERFQSLVDAKIFPISAMNQEGLEPVLLELGDMLEKIQEEPLYEEDQFEGHVLYQSKKEEPYTITREDNGTWVVHGEEIEKLFRMTKFTTEEGVLRFAKRLRKMGIDDKLEELGAKENDKVRILDFEFEYRK